MNSLRDELLKAGFKEPPKTKAKPKRSNPAQQRQQEERQRERKKADDLARVAKRKAIKEQISALINEHKIKDCKGDVVHHYTVGSRIRQLYLNESAHKRLIDAEVVITRLNGETCLIPVGISNDILSLNSEWAVYAKDDSHSSNDSDDYGDFPVPDDLKW